MKNIFLSFLLLLLVASTMADEGMWVPSLLGDARIRDMQSKGLRLSAEDLYSINNSSLKDAIVLFGRGCTGGIVSDQGLLLTNHHCGYGRIQAHSSIEHDYLTDGFWAMSMEEELPNPGLTVSLLVRMEDVTDSILAALEDNMTEEERSRIIGETSKRLVDRETANTHYTASVDPLFSGNQYFLYLYEVYKDVRLVGAPPSAIGKFGGDTDNWMWPRHTGDFSIFRIYADSNNMPAEYSKENIPYHPKKFLEISIQGIEKGDFTMVYGYPANTTEYLPASMVRMITEVSNPVRIGIRTKKLEIIENDMKADPKVRIQYSSKQAGIANSWKKWIGVNRGLQRFGALEKKTEFEEQFTAWVKENGKTQYENLLADYGKLVESAIPATYWVDHFTEAIWQMDIIRHAAAYRKLAEMQKTTRDEWTAEAEKLKQKAPGFFKDYNLDTDKKVFVAMLEYFRDAVGPEGCPSVYGRIGKDFGGDISSYADFVYDRSFLVSETRELEFLEGYKASHARKILGDPVYQVMADFFSMYINNYGNITRDFTNRQDSLQRIYMKAIMEMEVETMLYPDANFTLRVAYGQVNDYFPADATYYFHQTTLSGIMEKDDPEIYDYRVPDKLKELYGAKDYGAYGKNGLMPVCFTASNHTTGGNSGSPVLNADGRLIGLNFDRNWEGTMSDIMYDPDMCRNIVLDIRYCLFIIDRYAGADRLIKEMTIL